MINGIINIYKEAGFTSFDVVAKLRGIVKQKKIGHTGTLDPDAVGVLPVCFGNATKLCDMMTDRSKEYEACMRLGVTTDTQDMSGKVLSEAEVSVTPEQVREAIMSFVGGYEQIPPMYSALKVNGKKLYELARAGKEIERQPRHVDIPSIKITEINIPLVSFVVECSKGTYIRSLCDDIGKKLGCGAAMETLKRTRVGNFHIEDSITLSELEESFKSMDYEEFAGRFVMSSDRVFMEYEKATITDECLSALLNGNKLYERQLDFEKNDYKKNEGNNIRVYDNKGEFKAVYTYIKNDDCFKPYKMFL
jgi:tRNA pseudouridine55 synthase